MPAPLYNIGPDAIGIAGVSDGPGLTLARPEWIAVQAHCLDLAALPTTHEALGRLLGADAPGDPCGLAHLVETFAAAARHSRTWAQIYPAVVALAEDTRRYGSEVVPTHYPRLLVQARALQSDPADGRARTALWATLNQIREETAARSRRAGVVAEQIRRFAEEVENLRATLVGDGEGDGGLVEQHLRQHESSCSDFSAHAEALAKTRAIVVEADAAYNRDVVLTATSATYSWVYPLGSVAAAVVAGCYGRRAAEAVQCVRAVGYVISRLPAREAAAARLALMVRLLGWTIEALVDDIAEVLPVIQRIQGTWGGIAADLATVSAMLDEDAGALPAIVQVLDVPAAVAAWSAVAAVAGDFGASAYIEEDPHATMTTWKDRTQTALAPLDRAVDIPAHIGGVQVCPMVDWRAGG